MEFSISGKVTLQDYIQFCKSYQKSGFFRKYNLTIFPILFLLVAYIYLPKMEVLQGMLRESPLDFIKIILPLIIVLAFIIVFNTAGMNAVYKGQYNADKIMRKNQNIKVGKTWITITTDAGSTNVLKSHITKIVYDKNAIYIYEGRKKGYIIKKDFMENENDFDELTHFMKTNYELE